MNLSSFFSLQNERPVNLLRGKRPRRPIGRLLTSRTLTSPSANREPHQESIPCSGTFLKIRQKSIAASEDVLSTTGGAAPRRGGRTARSSLRTRREATRPPSADRTPVGSKGQRVFGGGEQSVSARPTGVSRCTGHAAAA